MKNGFFKTKKIIGMVHLLPLPGCPNFDGDIEAIEARALEDAKNLKEAGVSGFIIENFGDVPYDNSISLEAYTVMSNIVAKIKSEVSLPFGINVQFNCFKEEWALAYANDADFVRIEAYVEKRFSSYGESDPCAAQIQRLKKQYPCKSLIFADVNGKHTYGVPGISIEDAIHDAIEAMADAVIVTGKFTGQNPSIEDIKKLRSCFGDFPIIIGSGVNADNVNEYLEYADGVIVGSSLKVDGIVTNKIDLVRAKNFMSKINI